MCFFNEGSWVSWVLSGVVWLGGRLFCWVCLGVWFGLFFSLGKW